MKKLIALVLSALLLIGALPASAQTTLANPWIETTAEGILQSVGVKFGQPEGAEGVIYRMLQSASLAEMHFSLDGADYVARIQPTASFEDISGLYYDPWAISDQFTISDREAQLRLTRDGERIIALCLWYDAAPGLMYSLTAYMPSLSELSIISVAGELFLPMQGEADPDAPSAEETLYGMLFSCTGYAGTAGSSLKGAKAACEMAKYALDEQFASADLTALLKTVQSACSMLDEERRSELIFNLSGIHRNLTAAYTDYASIRDLFDTAGVAEGAMDDFAAQEEGYLHWCVLYALLSDALN